MRFETHLIKLLETEFEQNIAQLPARPDFFESAVKTARLSCKAIRLKLIADMATALGCTDEDLMFLFDDMSYNDNDIQTALPSFRESIALEAAE